MRAFVICALWVLSIWPAYADRDAYEKCARYGLTNVDCACVSKRYDAYLDAANEPQYKRIVKAGYDAALGDDAAFNQLMMALRQDVQGYMRYQNQFTSISGGEPSNIDNFFEGCAIAGAAKTPLPPVPSAPIYGKIYAACMAFYPDQRSCQCQAAQIGDATSEREAKAYYYSFNEKGNGGFDEENRNAARKAGLTLDDYFAADKAARSKIGDNYSGAIHCSVLRWADGREGRSDAERAGIPKGFENYQATAFVDPKAEMEAARQRGEAMKAKSAAEIAAVRNGAIPSGALPEMPASSPPKASISASSSPRAILQNGCASADKPAAECSCLAEVFDTASAGASPGVTKALAMIMGSGGLDEMQMMRMMQSGAAADVPAASQLMMQNFMQIQACAQ
ncbi:MAG: hypothetical protein AAF862_12830 [Pseudomonadota bacterium]